MPWPTRSLTSAASGGKPVEASISSRLLFGLISTTEPLEARISRTTSCKISRNACGGSSVEWMTLLIW